MQLKSISLNEDKSLPIYSRNECQKVLDIYQHYYTKFGFDFPWLGYFVYDEDKIVGTCGFNGPPKFGKVEIAYWTFREFEGKGIATFACQELLNVAHRFNSKMIVVAKTGPRKSAATKVLEKNKFTLVGVIRNDGYEDVWYWKDQGTIEKNDVTIKSNF